LIVAEKHAGARRGALRGPRRQGRPNDKPNGSRAPAPPAVAGLAARQLAVALVDGVIARRQSFDDTSASAAALAAGLEPRDRALARLIAATVLRRLGELEALVASFLEKPLPARTGALQSILLAGAAQLTMIGTPPHAAISLAVDQTRQDRHASRFAGLVNAVLRRVATDGPARLATFDPVQLDIPAWLLTRWQSAYGEAMARGIAEASLREAPLDISVKSDAAAWAERLGGVVLPTGSIRTDGGGRIDELPGFGEGAWWVQDAAAALPARLLGDVAGLDVADICAAPGGKTAELAAEGARVTAVDRSAERLARVTANLARLGLAAETVVADAGDWQPGRTFDAVLLDAPCTATGTIRRHPDILRLRRPADIAQLAQVQRRLLEQAATLVRSGGRLVYCTCSLEPEEGPAQVAGFLASHPEFVRQPITPVEIGGAAEWITGEGDLRTLPCYAVPGDPAARGLDGFYAARLARL